MAQEEPDLVRRRAFVVQLYELPTRPSEGISASGATTSIVAQTGHPQVKAIMTKGESPASLPLVQRQTATISRAVEPTLDEVTNRRATTTTEIRAASSGVSKPAMVWRQSAAGSSSGATIAGGTSGDARSAFPLAITTAREQQVARQATTAESTSSISAESTALAAATPVPATPPAQEIDIERLADQVSELLGRRLEIERERRGITGWH